VSTRSPGEEPVAAGKKLPPPEFLTLLGREGIGPHTVRLFRRIVLDHYRCHGRSFPWRMTRDPYRILVSEFMLQQTQVERVVGKYEEFLKAFPDLDALGSASLSDVLSLWQGLGYNRRAKALRETARLAVREHGGHLPDCLPTLLSLPGVGQSTAGAVTVFAFGRPAVFLETNIRRVFLAFFFSDQPQVSDREIFPYVAKTLDAADPREWYYALMDYGTMLKKELPNPNRRSAHYRKQSPFEGSDRQVRSRILRALLRESLLVEKEVVEESGLDRSRVEKILEGMHREGLILRCRGRLSIP
jgi:A/G-specific adenine glycosylase